MNNSLFDKLNKYLLEIYSDEDYTKFDVGKILSFDSDWVLINAYDTFGADNGYLLLRIDSIHKIGYNTQYLNDIFLNVKYSLKDFLVDKKKNLFDDILDYVLDNEIVSITLLNGDTVTGVIFENDDSYLQIRQIQRNGLVDGCCILFKDLISSIQYNSVECKRIKENNEKIK